MAYHVPNSNTSGIESRASRSFARVEPTNALVLLLDATSLAGLDSTGFCWRPCDASGQRMGGTYVRHRVSEWTFYPILGAMNCLGVQSHEPTPRSRTSRTAENSKGDAEERSYHIEGLTKRAIC